jgi:2-isopropylmalate synthase
MPDTVGYSTPEEYAQMFREVRERIPAIDAEGVILSAHTHDDLGLAVATSLAAIKAGARQVECAINGIGERAGNAALEEIAAALFVRADYYGVSTNIKLDKLVPTSQTLGQLITFSPSPNKAIVGANAFAHESGIHQHGMLANPLCYEIMTPASVGAASTNLVLGKHSGRAALRNRLEQLGYTVDREELQQVYYRFVALADRKKNIYDIDLIGLLPQTIRDRKPLSYAEVD